MRNPARREAAISGGYNSLVPAKSSMSFKRDSNGIPILDAEEVELLAEGFLAALAPEVLTRPLFTPIAEIVYGLQQRGHLTFELWADLGMDPKGHKYLGWYVPSLRLIRIDKILGDSDPRFPFTVTHELGHFYLHNDLNPEVLDNAPEIRDSTREIVIHRVESSRPRTFIEWQANRFAAAVLIPRRTIRDAVVAVQQNLGISRRLGTVWVDSQPCNVTAYRALVGTLSEQYRTSRAVVTYRLRDLGIALGGEPPRGHDFTRLGEL